VLDSWFAHEVQPRLRGEACLYRFADASAIVCAAAQDARRLLAVLPQRVGKYGLPLPPDKTRVVRCTRPPSRAAGRRRHARGGPGSFDLRGFTHDWGRARQGNGGQAEARDRTA
jgi:RNA-directed DNA polymerase